MSRGRLIVDAAAEGARNMAVDQALLEEVDGGAPVTLRFYAWDRPTLSLGYFQTAAERDQHAESAAAALVRRATGGGAILHDAELTYSLCVAIRDRTSPLVRAVYDSMHRSIIAALADHGVRAMRFADSSAALPRFSVGITAESSAPSSGDARAAAAGMGCGAARSRGSEAKPFLCFQRRTDEDLIVAGYKIAGSAQRRAARAVLQHGSVLLAASPLAPQLPGIFQLTSHRIPFESLAARIAAHAANELDVQWEPHELSSAALQRSLQLVADRFAAEHWTARR